MFSFEEHEFKKCFMNERKFKLLNIKKLLNEKSC